MTRRRPEAPVLALALVLAALGEVRTFAGLVAAYGVAWTLVEGLLHTRFADAVRNAPRGWLAAIGALALIVSARGAARLAAEEGLLHWPRLVDRARLSSAPTLDPTFLRADAPQSFVLHAPGVERARLAIAEQAFDAVPLGAGTLRIDVDPDGLTLEPGPLSATLTLDGEARAISIEVIVPHARPRGLVLSPDRTRACAVSEETDELFLVDADVTARADTLDRPVACGFLDDRTPVVAHASGTVWDGAHHVPVARLDLPMVHAAARAGTFVAVGRRAGLSSELVVVEGGAWPSRRRLVLEGLADRVALGADWREDPRYAVVALRAPARLVVVELATLTITAERPLQAPATALFARWRRVVIGATDFAETPAPNLGNHFLDEQLVELGLPDLRVLGVLRPAGRTAAQDHAGDVDAGAGAAGISVDEDDHLVVAFEGTRDVATYARLDAPPRRTALRGAEPGGDEHAPESAVVLADGTLVIASPASGAILRIRGERIAVEHLAPTRHALLRSDPEALRARMGELAFGETTRSGVSCASCHPGGGSDHVGHNIGGRLLAPTLDARGLSGTAPYLRDGSYPRIRDLMEVADHEYRGYRWPAGDRGATIEGFLARTARPPTFTTPDPELVRRGAEVFERARCLQCHVPPAFTDLGQHAGIALFPRHDFPANVASLDTPSLRGLSESPPYLYDGRARTLRDVVTTENEANQHGDTASLEAGELDALVAFLEAIP